MKQNICYKTELTIAECIRRIIEQPWEYGDQLLDPMWYQCDGASDTRLFVTFRGGKFRKAMKTQYEVIFSEVQGMTLVTLSFRNELFGMPPMTPPQDIDLFMAQKISAVRMD